MSLTRLAPPAADATVSTPSRISTSSTPAAGRPQRGRDAAVDVARAWCLVVVVALHALMVGVSVGAGGPVLENALEAWPGLPTASWLLQVMPLFFLLGGFSSFTQWSRLRSDGGRYGAYLAGRVGRLLRPALGAMAAVILALAALQLAGVPAAVVSVAGFRLSQPLWFLGVYLLCTVAAPALIALHRRAPVLTLASLVGAAVAVDVVRGATGLDAIGFANLLFLWLAVQQLGFWLADGRFDGSGRPRLALSAGIALASLVVLCSVGVWSPDMLANLNPPSTALLALAVVQLAAFDRMRPLLRRAAEVRAVAAVVRAVGDRAMTVYSWHMLALVALAGALLLSGADLPAIGSPEWWLTRPLWLLAVAIAVTAVVTAAGRLETSGRRAVAPAGTGVSTARSLTAAAAGAAGVLLALVSGGVLAGWVAAGALLLAALRICAVPPTPRAALGRLEGLTSDPRSTQP